MYVIAEVSFPGDDATYEVGGEVEYDRGGEYGGPSYEVGEPDISAPDCSLKVSRLLNHDTLPTGWSGVVESALIEEYAARLGDAADARADYEYERSREDES